MPHPHMLQKSMKAITVTARTLIEDVYQRSLSATPEGVWRKSHITQGILMLWSELCFDMGVTAHINVAEQNELEALAKRLDADERARLNMPQIQN